MNILFLDIETTPNLADVWGMWQQNVSINQLRESQHVLCLAAKWAGSDEVKYYGKNNCSQESMIKQVWALLDEADVVVHYNGIKFDIPHLNREFLELQLRPPSTFKQVDLLNTVRSRFRFPSNKLDYVAKALDLGSKVSHEGHELWVKCMAGDSEAWDKMEAYNIHDVYLTEKLFNTLRPWIKPLPNLALYNDEGEEDITCPSCGSENLKKKGFEYTSVSKFQRYVCGDCGKNARGRKNVIDRTNLLVGV